MRIRAAQALSIVQERTATDVAPIAIVPVAPVVGLDPMSDQAGIQDEIFVEITRRGIYARLAKPVMERVFGLILALVTLPLSIVIALKVRIALGPGVLFRQERVGLNGCTFTMYKFRSMAADGRQAQLPFEGEDRRRVHKSPQDPRHTPFGRFIRKWSLDELPQLWNVVRGDMGLIGPRPELVSVVAHYEPWQHLRHAVKPGLTGLWQVKQRGAGCPMHDATELDLEYIRRLSLPFDLMILMLTVPALIRRTGA